METSIIALVMFTLASLGQVKKADRVASYKQIDSTKFIDGTESFTDYQIKKGKQHSKQSSYAFVNTAEMKFMVRFDSSAIYQTENPVNQGDINKLYGFSDNYALHHKFSARFGWRWFNNELQLLAYVYNKGTMSFQQIGTVNLDQENTCSIQIAADKYIFTLNGTTLSMPRASTASHAVGYKLFPYFGGDETAPHDVHIWIKDL